ncbi:MAG: alanine--tRNA ligase [Phycisphaerales bacterium]|nr:alanine--tRNA ligase [Phycisphaerales bacterium]
MSSTPSMTVPTTHNSTTTPGSASLTAGQIRQAFIDYFAKKHTHSFVPSSPSVPHDDPTLLFTNAGMNQFKPIFLGKVDPHSEMGKLKRAVNSQKCIRAGGKHNDLEDVGKDTYHHTFFEMLGNWSFGDYFKKEAIEWSWELLTKVYGIPADRLYATYFGGNLDQGLEPDEETKQLWLKFLPANRVIPGNMKDNFWEMGDTGPCGPCTEIHVDRIGGRDASKMVNASDPDVIEIWNNVFIQFNREEGGKLRSLPAKHVDTGMGFERLVSILQNKRSNYDTDVFSPLFAAIQKATGFATPYSGKIGSADVGNIDTAYRVIADHIRTLTIAITDGATPSNVGRGYVLRRILRRAVRYGRQMLDAKPGFFHQLVPTVVETMGTFFGELKKNPQHVIAVIKEEEESFGRTLDRGIKLFAEVAEATVAANAKVISGTDTFKLHDTYGFPPDLTALMAEERGLTVDMAGYEAERKKAEELSRSGGKTTEEKPLALDGDAVARLHHLQIHPTNDSFKFEAKPLRAHVKAIWDGDTFEESARGVLAAKKLVGVITDRTNFYAEMGGQVADTGRIEVLSEARSHSGDKRDGGNFIVEHTAAFGGYILHIGYVEKGEVRVGDTVALEVDDARRAQIAANHTGTHLVNFALRKILGPHIDQKGSGVAPDKMRFDFSHTAPVTPEQLSQAERIIRGQIEADLTVYAKPSPLLLARSISGLRAVFGEQYPDPVRVVSIGQPVEDLLDSPTNTAWSEMSIEFCGGTHVESTLRLAALAILSEEAVAKGVRRVVAVTGGAAVAAYAAADSIAARVLAATRLADHDLPAEVAAISTEIEKTPLPAGKRSELRSQLAGLAERAKSAEKNASKLREQAAAQMARQIAQSAQTAGDEFIVTTIDVGDDRGALQAAVKAVRDTCIRCAVMLYSTDPTGKVTVMASVPDGLISRGLKAGDWVREACGIMGGKGGGKPDNAQGGASDSSQLKESLKHARQYAMRVAK